MKVLMISPVHFLPDNTGNSTRIKNLLLVLKENEINVDYIHVLMDDGDEKEMRESSLIDNYYRTEFKKDQSLYNLIKKFTRKVFHVLNLWHIPYTINEYCNKRICEYAKSLYEKNKYDVVIIEYVFLSRILDYIDDKAVKIIDTHDVFTDRHKKFTASKERYKWFFTTEKEEAKGFKKADRIIAIQNNEGDFIKKLSPENETYIIGHQVEIKKLSSENEGNLLFFASENVINVKAIEWFVDNVFDLIIKDYPETKLIIAGRICKVLKYDNKNIVNFGEVDERESVYKKTTIIINPMRSGTGLKIKSIEALAYGKVLVTTSVGAEGLDSKNGQNFIIADEAKEFADSIKDLLKEPERMEQIQKNTSGYVSLYNKNIDEQIMKILKKKEG